MLKAALHRLAKGSLIYGVGGILQRFIGLLLLPFFTRVLSPTDYGVVALISLGTVAFSGLFSLGTGNSMGVLYFREKDADHRSTIIWSNVTLMTLNGSAIYILLFFFAPVLSDLIFQTESHANLIRLSLLGLLFTTVTDPFLAYLRMEEKAKRYVSLTLFNSLLTIGFSIWFVLVQRIGVTGVILAGTLGQATILVLCLVIIGRKIKFHVDFSVFRPLVRIGFPSIFGLFAFLLIDYADRQMIERIIGLDALGVYSVGYSFGMLMMIAVGAFSTAWPPFFMSYIHKHDEARTVFARVLTYYLIGFGALVVLFFCVARPVVLLFTAAPFHEAYVVVGLVATAYMLKGCYLIVLPGIYFAHKLHLQTAIEWVAAIVNIGLNMLLIPIYGILGAAFATFLSYLCLSVLAWLVSKRYLVVDYQWRRIFMTVSAMFFTCFFVYLISFASDHLLSNVILNACALIVYLIIFYNFILTGSERQMLLERVKL